MSPGRLARALSVELRKASRAASGLACALLLVTSSVAGQQTPSTSVGNTSNVDMKLGSTYLPVDSWIYPAVMRLYSLGYVPTAYLGMRPWTRSTVLAMVEDSEQIIVNDEGPLQEDAEAICDSILHELRQEPKADQADRGALRVEPESFYTRVRGMDGPILNDGFHIGQTIVNDYGRPFQEGFNAITGFSTRAEQGRFTLYVRGEFQHAPSATGYSAALAQTLSSIDETTFLNPVTGLPYSQTTIPRGPIATATQGRFLEAYLSALFLNHIWSFGKQDEWMGPDQGASMAYSNNAENIYAFHINRAEPLYIPLLSRLTGPFRYEFLVGALRGHTMMPNPLYPGTAQNPQPNVINPGDPWVHAEKFSFKPTRDLEFGFERTVIWGGQGHEHITLHTFLKSFFSTNATSPAEKYGPQDPGARFGTFDFVYRLPFPGHWLTLYSDMEAHDAPSPIAKPLHGTFGPGLYLSQFPGIPKLDLRVEAADTDSSYPESIGGRYQYWESIQRQGYTNQGQLFGDWIGREDKGGQAWLTYHLDGRQWLQVQYRNQKAAKDFIPGGTTLHDFGAGAFLHPHEGLDISAQLQVELWKAPLIASGQQHNVSATVQVTYYPGKVLHPHLAR